MSLSGRTVEGAGFRACLCSGARSVHVTIAVRGGA